MNTDPKQKKFSDRINPFAWPYVGLFHSPHRSIFLRNDFKFEVKKKKKNRGINSEKID